jgi:hypothetical protein
MTDTDDNGRVYQPLPEYVDRDWEGIVIEYVERASPTSTPYKRCVPGWRCRHCGYSIGTSDLPPSKCPRPHD